MLVIRMQRTGRKGHAQFRVVVQDSRRTPTSGKVIAALGSYDPHSKVTTLNKDKAAFYLEHGAQPSDRVASLLKREGLKLPSWVKAPTKNDRDLRNPDKLRKNNPAEPAKEETPASEPVAEIVEDASAEPVAEVAEEAKTETEVAETAEEPTEEAPAA